MASPQDVKFLSSGRRVAADNFARWLSAARYFPDPPGIGGESPRTMRTIIFYQSLLPLQCPVSLPCGGLRLYLPPGGRWLGAQPQDGGSHRAHGLLDCREWYLPRGSDNLYHVPPRMQTGSLSPAGSLRHGLRRASSLPEGAMGFCVFTLADADGKAPIVNPSDACGTSSP